MDYKARFYSPALGRFTQPDTITPNMTQGLNRYSYVGNSPIIFSDPSGHRPVCDEPSECKRVPKSSSLLIFKADDGQNWTDQEKKILKKGANDIAKALARDINSENRLLWKMGEIDQYQRITSTQAFNNVFGGPIVVRRSGSDCDCWAQHMNKQDGQHYEIWIFSTTSAEDLISHPYLIVHEIGHAFNAAVGGQPAYSVPGSLFRPTNSEGIIGTDIDGNFYGYHGAHFQWQFGKTAGDAQGGEEFADMFVGWTYGKWENSSIGINRQNFMNSLMVSYLFP